jgi:hypothetical protein
MVNPDIPEKDLNMGVACHQRHHVEILLTLKGLSHALESITTLLLISSLECMYHFIYSQNFCFSQIQMGQQTSSVLSAIHTPLSDTDPLCPSA